MHALESLLRRSGKLSDDQVHTTRRLVDQGGRGWVDALIELHYFAPGDLAGFLQSKLLIPRVEIDILDRVATATSALIPGELAHRHCVLPVAQDGQGNLTVAMADPTDEAAVDAVTKASGTYVIRAVAALDQLRPALERCYGPSPNPATGPAVSRQTAPAAPPMPSQNAWKNLDESWNAIANDPLPAPSVEIFSPADFARAADRLKATEERDALSRVALDFLGRGLQRVMMLVNTRGELRGHDGRGADLWLEMVRQIRIPSDAPSRLAGVMARRRPYLGPLGEATEVDRRLFAALGRQNVPVLIFPVLLGERVPLLFFGHSPLAPIEIDRITSFSECITQTLQRMISAHRSNV